MQIFQARRGHLSIWQQVFLLAPVQRRSIGRIAWADEKATYQSRRPSGDVQQFDIDKFWLFRRGWWRWHTGVLSTKSSLGHRKRLRPIRPLRTLQRTLQLPLVRSLKLIFTPFFFKYYFHGFHSLKSLITRFTIIFFFNYLIDRHLIIIIINIFKFPILLCLLLLILSVV